MCSQVQTPNLPLRSHTDDRSTGSKEVHPAKPASMCVLACLQESWVRACKDATPRKKSQKMKLCSFGVAGRAVGEGSGTGGREACGGMGGKTGGGWMLRTSPNHRVTEANRDEDSTLRKLPASGCQQPMGQAVRDLTGSGIKDSRHFVQTGPGAGRLRCLPAPTSGEVSVVFCCRLACFCVRSLARPGPY